MPPRGLFENDPDPNSENTFENSLFLLITTIDTDLDATREHTEWGKKALEWEKHTRDRSFLLSGSELEAAEQWLVRRTDKGPEPTDLQKSYVLASRQRATLPSAPAARWGDYRARGRSRARRTSHSCSGTTQSTNPTSPSQRIWRRRAQICSRLMPRSECSSACKHTSALPLLRPGMPSSTPRNSSSVPPLPTARRLTASPSARAAILSLSGMTVVTLYFGTRPSGQRTATLVDGSPVESVAFSPSGQTLAVGDQSGHVGLWDVASGQRTATLVDGSPVESVAFSPSGQTLAIGDQSGHVGLWDFASGQRSATLANGGTVDSVAFSPNGQTLAVGDSSGEVDLWDAVSGVLTTTLSEGSVVKGVAFSPNGQTLAVGDQNGYVGVWDVASGRLTTSFDETSSVFSVAFSPDGQTLAAGDQSGHVDLWDIANGQRVDTLAEGATARASPSARTARPLPSATTAVGWTCGM